ncbi:MAG: hypothetical protein NTW13_05350, partial [Candidatus Omnitrophica bacterium]|nr:hypothetical protein [Candidatus Omnitrophota bacterium]
FERMEILGKAARVFLGIPQSRLRRDNCGTAMLFERLCARARGASSADAKNTRDLCRPTPVGKIDLSEKLGRVIYKYKAADKI